MFISLLSVLATANIVLGAATNGKVLFYENFANGGFKQSWVIEKGHWNSAPGIANDARWKFGTGEIQNCTAESLTFNDGKMQITASALPDGTYNSGRIYSNFAVGPKPNAVVRIEAKIQLPAGGKGIWPAFWMLPKTTAYGVWPRSGEIDIGEFNTDMSKVYTNLHYGNSINASPSSAIGRGFHTFTLDWTLDSMVFSLDGVVYSTVPKTKWNSNRGRAPFDQEFFILLNLSLGGWAGQPDKKTVFPQVMTVEYVKVTETPK
jgi:beta-glucanase (GH16 family)